MHINIYTRAAEFLEVATPSLLEHEATHNLLLGLSGELVHNPHLYSQEEPFFALIFAEGRPIGAALRTPPYLLSLGLFEATQCEQALAALAELALEHYPDLNGVNGPAESSDRFASIWEQRTGRAARISMAQRIYQLTQVQPPQGVSGQLRVATAADRAMLVKWVMGFHRDAMGSAPDKEHAIRSVARWLEAQGRSLFLWEDAGRVVCMTGVAGATPHGIRVSAVYTPEKHRRQGYASACVAAVSQRMLDQGRSFCFLYTDLANPISNSIYQRIGYRPVCDVNEYHFGKDEG